ncbi:hypothetical protein LPJ61_000162 [Coemansia biformis]|uniref:C2H2-type domain-containing protein n=1 Tax=Coemansia biformis TaxID=1286918 RepID=A0A9W7YC71_9FUNG|nr:hypothetical protein LPJ61_000162 [Coemansia biformis]
MAAHAASPYHSADSDADTLTPSPTLATLPSLLAAASSSLNTTTATNNNNSTSQTALTAPTPVTAASTTTAKDKLPATTGDLLLDSFITDEYYSPDQQLLLDAIHYQQQQQPQQQQPPPLLAINTTRSLPNLAEYQTPAQMSASHSFSASLSGASVPCTPAMSFGGFGVPATAPLRPLLYREPSALDSALLSAYDPLLNTPAGPADSALLQAHHYGHIAEPLFAPLDEIRSRESTLTDDLIVHLASTDPEFRQSLVHALVNHINPVLAYEPVGPMAMPSPALSPESLLAQARSIASTSAASPGFDAAHLPWSASIESEAPFVDSLLALLGPIHTTPATSSASPAVLELFSPAMAMADVFQTPRLPAIAEEECTDSGDAPLPAPSSPCGVKRPRDDDDDEEEANGEDGLPKSATGKQFYCDICNRGFSRQYNMRTHRLTHDPRSVASRPHKCPQCPRSFTRKHDLERHQVLHDDTDSFKCNVCGRGFARLDVLERHANALHRDSA